MTYRGDAVAQTPSCFCFHCHAVLSISFKDECSAFQWSSSVIRRGLAHSTGGSPGRRALTRTGMERPVTSATASQI